MWLAGFGRGWRVGRGGGVWKGLRGISVLEERSVEGLVGVVINFLILVSGFT